ncbi:MAG TPA: NADH-quinone oxidoreductase subunit NuoF [bacterium]|jgi:NADH-quinone oxidoreductase subunit F|nr:NADH-quinone oxidoreductase subunit NuoF [bacterium]
MEACPLYLTKNFKNPAALTFDGYVASGGYVALKKALSMQPQEIIDLVKAGNLRGRGGAGFPAGVKWGFLGKTEGPKYLCVNADEGEPGTVKDGPLMEFDPHQMIEGIAIACFALGIKWCYIYIRGEFYKAHRIVQKAVDEAYAKGVLGPKVMGSGFQLDVALHPGGGAYICGEETGLLSSLEGKKGFPKLKPPFPALKGLYGAPTIVNNVETLACVPHIINLGAEAWNALGTEKNGGTKMYNVCGHVMKPGYYETRHSITLRELIYDVCGGMKPGRTLKGVVPGGSSSPILLPSEIDVRMDFDSLGKAGTMLGSAAVIVMDDRTSIVRALDNLLHFYSHESCGQCTPCREGTHWLYLISQRIVNGEGKAGDVDRMLDICNNMVGNTICVLADAAALPTQSYIKKYRAEFDAYVLDGGRVGLLGNREEKAAAHA